MALFESVVVRISTNLKKYINMIMDKIRPVVSPMMYLAIISMKSSLANASLFRYAPDSELKIEASTPATITPIQLGLWYWDG